MRDEAGFTLIELLISIVVMSLVMIAVLAGMNTSSIAGRVHRRQADATSILLSAAERLRSNVEVAYKPCAFGPPTDPTYINAIRSVPVSSTGFTTSGISITTGEYWNGTTFGSTCRDCPSTSDSTCVDSDGNLVTYLRLQRIALQVTSADGSVTERLTIIKRGTP